MAYREPGPERITERNPSGPLPPPSTAHGQPARMDDGRPAAMQDPRRERDSWRRERAPEDDGRYDEYPRNPETAEWLRRTQGRETEREREVYMLERERDLREREKQRDAWYRHANSAAAPIPYENDRRLSRPQASPPTFVKGPATDRHSASTLPRSGRDEWEIERTRAYHDEEYGRSVDTSRHRTEDADYQRAMAAVSVDSCMMATPLEITSLIIVFPLDSHVRLHRLEATLRLHLHPSLLLEERYLPRPIQHPFDERAATIPETRKNRVVTRTIRPPLRHSVNWAIAMLRPHLHQIIPPGLRNTVLAVHRICLWAAKIGPLIRITIQRRITIAFPDTRIVLLHRRRRRLLDSTLAILHRNTLRGMPPLSRGNGKWR